LRWIEGFKKAGRLLDIGCSQGDLLMASRSRRWDAVGIDLCPSSLDYARSEGLNVSYGTLEDHTCEEESFDVVAALHVIEHVCDPIATMKEIRRILKPGGITVIITPCVSHIRARLAGDNWKVFRPPEHLWYFSTGTLRLLLEKTGFHLRFASSLSVKAQLRAVAEKH
jgi:2-polyprenyl-3-methyl-5-hydroxy-6-metoxy-1,4-benzoquinol methylase